MKKTLFTIGLFSLAAACLLTTAAAEEEDNILAPFTPEGYDYTLPTLENPADCIACKYQQNYHNYRAVGISEPTSSPALTVTGKGWISSAHATSFDAPTNNNSYCAWCHMPTALTITSDNNKAKKLKPGKWHGMSCSGCHTTHHIAGEIGTT